MGVLVPTDGTEGEVARVPAGVPSGGDEGGLGGVGALATGRAALLQRVVFGGSKGQGKKGKREDGAHSWTWLVRGRRDGEEDEGGQQEGSEGAGVFGAKNLKLQTELPVAASSRVCPPLRSRTHLDATRSEPSRRSSWAEGDGRKATRRCPRYLGAGPLAPPRGRFCGPQQR